MLQTLPKKERLYGKAAIAGLLAKGRFGHEGCLKYCWTSRPQSHECDCNRLLISVSKKLFKRAVKRNLLKRRLREAYRRSKGLLGEGENGYFDIMLVYNTKEILDYQTILSSVESILSHVAQK